MNMNWELEFDTLHLFSLVLHSNIDPLSFIPAIKIDIYIELQHLHKKGVWTSLNQNQTTWELKLQFGSVQVMVQFSLGHKVIFQNSSSSGSQKIAPEPNQTKPQHP